MEIERLSTRRLAYLYLDVERDLACATTRKVTRRHKVGAERQQRVLDELARRRPDVSPIEVIGAYRELFEGGDLDDN